MTLLHTTLCELLAVLRGIHWHAWTTHWKTSGPDFYGDHLLFQRIYESTSEDGGGPDISAETDGLGERIVALYGPSGIDAVRVQERALAHLKGIVGQDPIQGALALEKEALRLGAKAAGLTVNLPPEYSVNLDNYLRSLVDERSTVIYLLQQRLGHSPNPSEFGTLLSIPSSPSASNLFIGALLLGALGYGVYTLNEQRKQLTGA